MYPTNTFYLDKSTDPFADTLAAHGLASLLRTLLEQADPHSRVQRAVRIVDRGAYYELQCSQMVDDDLIALATESDLPAPFQALQTAKNADSLAGLPACISYEAERDRRAAYFEWFNALPREQRVSVMRGETVENLMEPPHLHWDTFRAINPAALIGYNALAINWWVCQQALPQVLDILLGMVSTVPNDLKGAEQAWKRLDKEMGWGISADSTALQLFNPAQGKGQNRAKANNLSMGNVSGFWLMEWLKVAGFYQAGMTRLLSTEDRKSYGVAPINIDGGQLARINERFSRAMVGREGAIRSDVLASLRFTITLLDYSAANPAFDRFHRPRDLVAGFYTVFYKDLGNAVATMNLSFIALPGWVQVTDAASVREMRDLLEEHEKIVLQFDETHSDEIALLQAYRDFLSGDDIEAFFKFTTAYAGFIISRREHGLYAYQLTTQGVERLVMNTPSYYELTQDEGIRQIAYAIRHSTVVPQYRKAQYKLGKVKEGPIYDIRYGLHHELSRNGRRTEDFVNALTNFLTTYNAETTQVLETQGKQYRKTVSLSAIERVLWLIDQRRSAKEICNVLIACGYAYDDTDDDKSQDS